MTKLSTGKLKTAHYKPVSKQGLREETNDFMVDCINKVFELGYTTPEEVADNIDMFLQGSTCMSILEVGVTVKSMVHYGLYLKTIKNCGTEKHHDVLMRGIKCQEIGCFGLTEVGHGSNVRGIETIAVYDKQNKSFTINSPSETSIKFWIGNLADTCQMAVVWA